MIELPRGVRLVPLSLEKLQEYWERVRDFDGVFVPEGSRTWEGFLEDMQDRIIFEVEDGGIVMLEDVHEGQQARFHAVFWDKRLSPRTEVLRELVWWLFLQFNLLRLETTVAVYAKAVRRFLQERLGFRVRRRLEEAAVHNGHSVDFMIYCLEREQVERGWQSRQKQNEIPSAARTS